MADIPHGFPSQPPLELPAHIRGFLEARLRHAVIATLNGDGSAHQTVIWFLLRDGLIVVNSRAGRRWPSNLLRDPRISLTVEEGDDAVTISGTAHVEGDAAQAQADIAEMAYRYYGADKAEHEIARFQTEQRLRFVLRPRTIHTHGDPR